MKIKYILPILFLLGITINSCKNVIDLNLNNAASQLVIEGNLTDQLGPQTVVITRSVPLDHTNVYPPVRGATVKLIDYNGITFTLIERSPGVYYSTSFLGRYNQTYTLNALVDGKTYIAQSTMPSKVAIDSVALSVQHFANKTSKTIIIYYQDPPNTVNQYRFVLTVNGVQVKQVFARNDQFNNGRFVQQLLYQDDIELQSGDHVDIEMQCIDANMYTYWYTFTQQKSNGFNSTTPTNPPNNFNTDQVLGYFSVHTSQHKNIIIP
ncbi:DUF4249 domain-containing protein [Mucilaginibacter sp. UR6-11]|uniref:DUF4249 domain-containing protein n=1 Tax=Mucilaginibacter sp. UR6-11 TaxID=1435644 RepID=UPI001E47D3D5|nr:DUF4249 domain-containing protein [Mucilaginibacter sp. UR6-11]MCC8425381.1 DUF4249 domain-containing protein [Mucilaginibacter sp. UR6-11]